MTGQARDEEDSGTSLHNNNYCRPIIYYSDLNACFNTEQKR